MIKFLEFLTFSTSFSLKNILTRFLLHDLNALEYSQEMDNEKNILEPENCCVEKVKSSNLNRKIGDTKKDEDGEERGMRMEQMEQRFRWMRKLLSKHNFLMEIIFMSFSISFSLLYFFFQRERERGEREEKRGR